MRAGAIVSTACAMLVAACAESASRSDGVLSPSPSLPEPAPVNIQAGLGQPGSLDSMCELSQERASGLTSVWVVCPRNRTPSAEDARASLIRGIGIPIIPGGPRSSFPSTGDRWMYRFVVDTGERPLLTPGVVPAAAAETGDVATCVARFDLTAEGLTTNACVECAATGMREQFEQAARAAVASWLYPAAGEGAMGQSRTGLLQALKFELNAAEGSRIQAPPPPEMACGVPVPPEASPGEISVAATTFGPLPMVRIEPQYPIAAANRESQALCTIAYDLEPNGSTTNICAACFADSRVEQFERASQRAVAGWRFPPAEENRPDLKRTGLTTQLDFAVLGRDPLSPSLRPPAPTCDREGRR